MDDYFDKIEIELDIKLPNDLKEFIIYKKYKSFEFKNDIWKVCNLDKILKINLNMRQKNQIDIQDYIFAFNNDGDYL